MNERHSHVYSIFIHITPQALWRALTDGSITPQYYFSTHVKSTWEAGAPYRYDYPNGAQ